MANKTTSKNKPARKTIRPNEYYNPKTKRYEYHYKDCFGKERVISSYRLEMTDGVYESFQRIIENRYLKGDIEPVRYDEQGNAN